MTKDQLIDVLVEWKAKLKGSNPDQYRRALQERSKDDLRRFYDLIQEEAGSEVPKVPRALNAITDVVLNYDPHKKRRRR
jgi:hypothetical protein